MSTRNQRRQADFIRLFLGAPPNLSGANARSASILAIVTMSLFILNVVALLSGLSAGPLLAFGISNLVLVFVCYVLSRTQLFKIGAWLFVLGTLVEIFLVLLITQPPALTPFLISFLLLPSLMSTLLLDSRTTAIVAAVTVVGLLAVGVLAPWLPLASIALADVLIALILVLLVLTAFLRERDIETVEQQTRQIESYRTQLEQEISGRTRDMSAAAEIGRAITSIRKEEELLEEVVRLVTANFQYYLAQIYLMDETQQNVLLKETSDPSNASASFPKIGVGDSSLVGQVAETGIVSTINDSRLERQYDASNLPTKTRSQVALPLRTGEKILGVLDLHSTSPQILTQADIPIFQTIADQLAIALENVALFSRAQQNLEDIELLNRQLTGQTWSKFLSSQAKPIGYQTRDDAQVEPVPNTSSLSQRPDVEEAVRIPLKVRGETIGVLDVTPKEGTAPDKETQEVLEAVAERVALALESTRLSEQSQRQAAQEQLLSQLSAELQAATDMNAILKIAAEQASQSLGTSTGFVHLKLSYDLSLEE